MIAIERTHKSGQRVVSSQAFSRNIVNRATALLTLWMQRSRQRHVLSSLQDHELKDIGISRADAIQESNKPFWKG